MDDYKKILACLEISGLAQNISALLKVDNTELYERKKDKKEPSYLEGFLSSITKYFHYILVSSSRNILINCEILAATQKNLLRLFIYNNSC